MKLPTNNKVRVYTPPCIEMLSINAERGFAGSYDNKIPPIPKDEY